MIVHRNLLYTLKLIGIHYSNLIFLICYTRLESDLKFAICYRVAKICDSIIWPICYSIPSVEFLTGPERWVHHEPHRRYYFFYIFSNTWNIINNKKNRIPCPPRCSANLFLQILDQFLLIAPSYLENRTKKLKYC